MIANHSGSLFHRDGVRRRSLAIAVLGLAVCAAGASAQQGAAGPYNVLRMDKVGAEGGFEYVYADPAGQQLYMSRSGTDGHITVFELPSLGPAGEIAGVIAHGVAVDLASHHAFASSQPVAEFDTRTRKVIKTFDVDGERVRAENEHAERADAAVRIAALQDD